MVTAPPPPPQQTASDAPNPQRERPTSFDRFLAADPGVAPCDPSLKPSAAWTLDFLRQFSALRRRLQRRVRAARGTALHQAAMHRVAWHATRAPRPVTLGRQATCCCPLPSPRPRLPPAAAESMS